MASQWLYDPTNVWLSMPVTFGSWLWLHRYSNKYAIAARESMKPWLIAMAVALSVFLVARLWLPQTQWPWLYRLEWGASLIETYSEKIVPYPALVNVGLLCILFGINLYEPKFRSVTKGIDAALPRIKTFFSALAIFTNVSFFGGGHAAILLEATAQEKFDRLKDQSISVAELALSARLTAVKDQEIMNVKKYLDSIYTAASIDIENYNPLTDDFIPDWYGDPTAKEAKKSAEHPRGRKGVEANQLDVKAALKAQAEQYHRSIVKYMIDNRIKELKEAMAHARTASSSGKELLLPESVKTILRSPVLSDEEKKDAKDKFDQALDTFIDQASDLSAQPLEIMLTNAGLPEFGRSIIKDVYNAELLDIAKKVADPLADAFFKAGSSPIESIEGRVADAVERPIFDVNSIPREVVAPTAEERTSEKERRVKSNRIIEEVVKQVR
jgi:hypothetical protein